MFHSKTLHVESTMKSFIVVLTFALSVLLLQQLTLASNFENVAPADDHDSEDARLLDRLARLGVPQAVPVYFRKRFLGNGFGPGGSDNVNAAKEALAMCVFASKNNLPSAKDLCTRSRRTAKKNYDPIRVHLDLNDVPRRLQSDDFI